MKTEFTFYELLQRGETRQFVVPELQRDYVWEERNWRQLLESLRDAYQASLGPVALQVIGEVELQEEFLAYYRQQRHSYNLGFLYAYHDPAYAGHCFLIDGQQRLTTLFLLLLAAARQDGRTEHFERHYLTANGDPSLAYRVREAADEFLSNFVAYVLKGKSVDNLTAQSAKRPYWFFSTYAHDATVNQILANYRGMEKWLAGTPLIADGADASELASSFYDYLHEAVRFWYFDTSQSAQGEELYLSLNASGEPLTGSDNIKARLLADLSPEMKKEWGEKFEEWEQFFWLQCGASSKSNSDASKGLGEFFRWVAICRILEGEPNKAAGKTAIFLLGNSNEEHVQAALFPKNLTAKTAEAKAHEASERLIAIGKYHAALKSLYEIWLPQATSQAEKVWGLRASVTAQCLPELAWLHPSGMLTAKVCLRLLPVLAYLVERARQGDELTLETVATAGPHLFRVVRYFYNLHRVARVGKDAVDLGSSAIRSALQVASHSADVACLPDLPLITPTLDNELDKLRLFQPSAHGMSREQVELLCWKLEDYSYNEGELAHLCADLKTLDYDQLKSIDDKYQTLFYSSPNQLTLLQTVLLSFGGYMKQSSNNSYYVNYEFNKWEHNVRQPAFRSLMAAYSGQPEGLLHLYKERKRLLLKDVSPEKLSSLSAFHEQLFLLSALFDDTLPQTISPGEAIWDSGNYAGWYYDHEVEEEERVFQDSNRILNAYGGFGYSYHVPLLTKLRERREKLGLSYSHLVEQMLASLGTEVLYTNSNPSAIV